MNTIWKYQLEIVDSQTIEMPEGAQVLSVQVQNGAPCIWALVTPGNRRSFREIFIFGTGQPNIDVSGLVYVGTFMVAGGSFVGHVYSGLTTFAADLALPSRVGLLLDTPNR